MVRAAREAGVQVIWDLCHYGWPDGFDLFRPEFVDRFADYAGAVARLVAAETDEPPLVHAHQRDLFLGLGRRRRRLTSIRVPPGAASSSRRSSSARGLAALDAVWSADSAGPHSSTAIRRSTSWRIRKRPSGRPRRRRAGGTSSRPGTCWPGSLWPQLGGDERYLDILGINYYPNNQWILDGPTIRRDESLYRPFREILREVWERYGRPLVVAETGARGRRPRRLAALHGRRGAGRPTGGSPRPRHLPLSDPQLSGLGRRPPLPEWSLGVSRPAGGARSPSSARRAS